MWGMDRDSLLPTECIFWEGNAQQATDVYTTLVMQQDHTEGFNH